MRLNNVFYGFTIKGERKLLWKRFVTDMTSMGDVSRTVYFDMEEKKYLEINEVDVDTLVPITYLVRNERMSKRKVVKAFKADNEMTFDIKGVFFGNIVKKTKYKDLFEENNMVFEAKTINGNKKVNVAMRKNVLFARINDPEGKVQVVETNALYPWEHRVNNGMCVEEVRAVSRCSFDEVVVTKKKLLEAEYKKEL